MLEELWPDADHQLCVFHVIKDINKLILDAVRRMRTAMGRRGKAGRKKERGRKGAKSKGAASRRGLSVKEKAKFVFKRRHLIVKRQEKLTESERGDLTRMLQYVPALGVLRRFADRIYWVFDTPKDFHQASCRRAVIVRNPEVQAVPELVKALEQLDESKFPKIMAYFEESAEPSGADQQSRGADQPDVPVPGEGAFQMAAAEDAGAVRGDETRHHLERVVATRGPGQDGPPAETGQATQTTTEGRITTTSGRVKLRWC